MSRSPTCPHCKARFYSIYAAAMHREWTSEKRCLTPQEMEAKGMVLLHGAWLTGPMQQEQQGEEVKP